MILAVQFPKPYQASEFKDVFVAEMRYWMGALWIWNVARNFVCVDSVVQDQLEALQILSSEVNLIMMQKRCCSLAIWS